MKTARDLLSEARRLAGLTQIELATKLAVTQQYISKIEKGNATVATLSKILDALGYELALKKKDSP